MLKLNDSELRVVAQVGNQKFPGAENFTRAISAQLRPVHGWLGSHVFGERALRTIKHQRMYLRACDGVCAARAVIAQFIDW